MIDIGLQLKIGEYTNHYLGFVWNGDHGYVCNYGSGLALPEYNIWLVVQTDGELHMSELLGCFDMDQFDAFVYAWKDLTGLKRPILNSSMYEESQIGVKKKYRSIYDSQEPSW